MSKNHDTSTQALQTMPPNVRPIWTPQDAVDTAHQFHLEIANAERGQSIQTAVRGVKPGYMRPASAAHDGAPFYAEAVAAPRTVPRLRLVTPSRERRARVYDGLAVALLLTLCAAIGCIVVLASVPR